MVIPNLKNLYCGIVKPENHWTWCLQCYRRLGLPPPAKEVSDLKKNLELLMKEAQVPGDLSGFPLEEAAWCWFGGRVVGLRLSCEEIILERREILILWEISRAFQPRWNVFLIRRWSAVCTVRLKSNGLEEQLKHRGKAWLFWQRTKHRSWCIWADNVGLIKVLEGVKSKWVPICQKYRGVLVTGFFLHFGLHRVIESIFSRSDPPQALPAHQNQGKSSCRGHCRTWRRNLSTYLCLKTLKRWKLFLFLQYQLSSNEVGWFQSWWQLYEVESRLPCKVNWSAGSSAKRQWQANGGAAIPEATGAVLEWMAFPVEYKVL